MKQQFRITNFRSETMSTISKADEIISEYGGQKLTARQVYYQFVARDLIPNTPRSYQNLTSVLTDARYAGLMTQIKKLKPPPTPAKVTDSRARAYIRKYGVQSLLRDGLPRRELYRLLERAIPGNVDK